jgi:nitrite reductase/ring-hydroxylating ferredoxin subunit
LFADNQYVRIGELADLQKTGYLKVRLMGRQIMIVFSDGGPVAVDLDSPIDSSNRGALPPEFHRSSSDLLNLLTGSYGEDWGKLTVYPVRIDGNDVFVGVNPVN